eukprot:Gregarina_sp_Poly_1__7092@NODE_387_length_8987_cov_450_884305_g316_i0_p2_GENE_NODE_387_length_8987_cov_450_884305_g316_i0NODE_387_length_8987_cov_450_884305_g316_i0_p2_ORF_typecomplete_len692_score91_43NopRA1/PF16201_5/0_24NopRA1/PF16201_5/7_5e02_NODE_387_length_8987_cov_450_884305_g316_i01172078
MTRESTADQKSAAAKLKAQKLRDDFYAVQPGAPTGHALFTDKQKRGYELSLQGSQLGVASLSILDSLIPRLGDSNKASKVTSPENQTVLVSIVDLLIDAFSSTIEELVVPAGKAIWRLQKLLTARNANKKSDFGLTQVQSRILTKGQVLGHTVLRVFRKISSRPTLPQARQLIICSELLRFYLTQNRYRPPVWLMNEVQPTIAENGKKNEDDPRIRSALLAHVSLVLTSPYHSTASQMVKVASLQLLVDVMKSVQTGKANKQDQTDGAMREVLEKLRFSEAELKMIYSIFDEILTLIVRQASYSLSLLDAESNLVKMARYAYLIFLKSFPLKLKSIQDRMNKLIAYIHYEEPEGRKSAMNCINMLLDESQGLQSTQIRTWLAEPLWLKGGALLTSSNWGLLEKSMMKSLLQRLLHRIEDSGSILKLLQLASVALRHEMPSLLNLTAIALEYLNSVGLVGVSVDDLVKPLLWTVGAVPMSYNPGDAECQLQDSTLIKNFQVPALETAIRNKQAVRESLDVFTRVFLQPCPKLQSWLSQKTSKIYWISLAMILQLIECFVPALPMQGTLSALAQVMENAIRCDGVAREALSTDLKTTEFLGKIKRPEKSAEVARTITLRLRELMIEANNADMFELYNDGLCDCILGSIGLEIALL